MPIRVGADVRLRIIATSDVHANLLSYDYSANRPLFGQGLAQTASLIAAARAEVPDTILLDNGDFLQGTAIAELAARARRSRCHPVISAMNALEYDAATLGNHEFNFGLPLLARAIEQANFPLVSANVLTERGNTPTEDRTLVPPYVLIERQLVDRLDQHHRIRIGVLGLTPPEIMQWDKANLQGRIETRPLLEAARAWVPQMRKAGADVVICLAHTGISDGPNGRDPEGHAAEVLRLDGIDALVAGHSHLVFPYRGAHPDPEIKPAEGLISGKPAIQPGYNGSHLGILDLQLRHSSLGWRIVSSSAQLKSVSEEVAGLPPATIRKNAAPLRRSIEPDHRATLAWTRRPLAVTEVPLTTLFAQVADVAAMRLIGVAKIAHFRASSASKSFPDIPVIATAIPYRTGGRGGALNYTCIPPGPLSVRHLFDLYPFPNTVVAHHVTGADLRELLERAAAMYRTIAPGQPDQPLLEPGFPGYAMTTLLGLSYRLDLSVPARYDTRGTLVRPHHHRVQGMMRDGRPVQDRDPFILITNAYRTGGSLGQSEVAAASIALNDEVLCTDLLREYLETAPPLTAELLATERHGPAWGFADLAGASVLFETGAESSQYFAEIAHLRPQALGLTADGFHAIRLHL